MKSAFLLFAVTTLSIVNSSCVHSTHSKAELLVRVEPRYPVHARGEGWVKLTFDINKQGAIENIRIVDSQPARLFDRSAKKSLSQW